MRFGSGPLSYSIRHSDVVTGRPPSRSAPRIVPDNVPLSKGAILFETHTFGDYHAFESLQIVGLKRNGCIVVGLASAIYELTVATDVDPRQAYRDSIRDYLLANRGAHFTALPRVDYLYRAKRFRFGEIVEVQESPTTWGSTTEILMDLRSEPSHAAFRAKIQVKPKSVEHDI